MNYTFTSIITKCAIAVGGKIVRRDTAKLSQETEDLIKRRQSIKVSISTDRIELAELSTLIIRRKLADTKKYNLERIGHALRNGGSLKVAKRKLGIVINQMYALRDKESNLTINTERYLK